MPNDTDLPAYLSFHHPLVRDLCWMLSPSFDLLTELPPYKRFIPPQSPPRLRRWLEQLQSQPETLETFFDGGPHRRLGHHFEHLVRFYLTHAPTQPWQLIDHNRPIYTRNSVGHQITIGELDFLLAGVEGTVHLETAVKFFLGIEHAGGVRWLGPNLQDRLDIKLHHLREHQLPLSQLLETDVAAPLQRYFWVKGLLFHPRQQNLATGPSLVSQPGQNIWLTCTEALKIFVDDDWICLPKSRWLGCGIEDFEEQRATREHIQQHFAASDRVLMTTHLGSAARRMIVPDNWPDAARAALEIASES